MIKVAVNGYGTIGKRVADAIKQQNDMELVGVSKTRPSYEAMIAIRKGYPLFVPHQSEDEFEKRGIKVAGDINALFEKADIIVDATPGGIGVKYKEQYSKLGKKAIFQGGEKANVADISFSALCNYDEGIDKKYIRVVSCNTTGLLRVLCTINGLAGLERVRATIVRRGADPKETGKGPINSLDLDPVTQPSHHAADVKTVLKDLDIYTTAIIAPTTLMHMHSLEVRTKRDVTKEEVLDTLRNTSRIVVIPLTAEIEGTAEILEVTRDLGRIRGDLYEVAVFEGSIDVRQNLINLVYAVHQESIVVPENIDAIRASMGYKDSKELTDRNLGIMRGELL
ncbi:glyceraldehyde-3-phosphate dehydrogenase [Sulfolobales archaeon HS-7]|nr:glyceraldehyde-3-phosphate dehydrogenase [Sulfolobales archaeon HS-7]